MDNILCSIMLTLIFGAGNPRLYELYNRHQNAENTLSALLNHEVKGLLPQENNAVKDFTLEYAEDILNYCEKNNIDIITMDCETYPYKLSVTDCPPFLLYCYGDKNCLNAKKSIAIVGARKACAYSLKTAEKFSAQIAEYDIPVTSGFADGIDTSAHNGAVNAGGKTIAVLGCGIMYDYPKGKRQLKEKISQHGAVISEYPPLMQPQPTFFKVRNRIISGLSDSVLVAEAGLKSGSLNTAYHALDQGRDVFVLPPHDVFSDRFQGQISLIREGAREAFTPNDIIFNT